MKKSVEYEVAVHKASVPLAKDESISDYTQALNEAARAFVSQKLNMDANKDYCYTVEVYPASCVVSCSVYSGTKSKYGYYAVQYTRDDNKAFTFSDLTEVERVTTYRAKSQMKLTKSISGELETELFDSGDGVHGWKPTSKSLWNGVV